ncbi:phosphatase PAP2 family protein [Candidatus Poribacteria bacterium]|nr:phosphatase PAP2 family protein [Candidatus Poribacteria bacterium]
MTLRDGVMHTSGAFGVDFSRHPWLRHLRVCDWLFLFYLVATGLLILPNAGRLEHPYLMLAGRVTAILVALASVRRAAETKHAGWRFVRDAYIPVIMGWLYVETGTLNTLSSVGSEDKYLARADEAIFGFQPSLRFYHAFPNPPFSEFLNFCYFSYYFIFLGSFVLFWFRTQRESQWLYQRYLFLAALVMVPCYLFYVAVPTWGPQYIYADVHSRDNFSGYFFKWALDYVLERGERPTGAFPSSHTALSAAFLVLLWRWSRRWFWISLVPFIGLWFSTVYIQAHFAVDILAGLPLGFAVGLVAEYLEQRWRDPALEETTLARPDDPVVRNPVPIARPAGGLTHPPLAPHKPGGP